MFDTTPLREVVRYAPPSTVTPGIRAPRLTTVLGRDAAPLVVRWLAATLDELDYGIVLLFGGMRVIHLNDAARAELDDRHPLRVVAGELNASVSHDAPLLRSAIAEAASRGMRRLLTLGEEGERASVSVVPLGADNACFRAVLVMLGKRNVCESLSASGFARSHGLTAAETRVLVALCEGLSPTQVAKHSSVALSTVRTQIGSIRAKTGAESIRALVRQVAMLPPVKSVPLTRRDAKERDASAFVGLSAQR